jgi:hypothetical protein
MGWVIRNENDHDLLWNTDCGWVDDQGGYDTFSNEERETVRLPMEGEWEQVPWDPEQPSAYELYERTEDERLRTVM